ncbi:MAG: fatty acid desaturase family protein [Planctomycetaceae bacterium]|nr:fatty acid desaturase family protein [Planctomycetaceae bacterium]
MPLQATLITDTDEPVEEWQSPVPPADLRRLSELQPWRSLAHVAREWLLIAAPIPAVLALWQWNPIAGGVAYVAAVIWIGARQHALAILMHEAAHYRLLPNRNLNDFFGELLLGWPLLISMRAYRWLHFAHHRSPNTHDDPDWMLRLNRDWAFPKTRGELFTVLLRDLLALNLRDQLEFFGRYAYARGRKKTWLDALAAVFFISLWSSLFYFQLWIPFLLFWIVPMMTWLKVALRMRTIGEHYGVEYDHMLRQTRTTYPNLIERLLIAPLNIGYHLDHHLYPSVPFYHLPELHRELQKHDAFRSQAHITRTYRAVVDECTHCIPTPIDAPH